VERIYARPARFKFDILLTMIRVFAGNNFYLIKNHVDKLKSDFISKNGDMSIEEIDCEDAEIGTLVTTSNTASLFSEKKLIIAKNIAQNKNLSEQIEQIFSAVVSTEDFVVVEKNIDKRSAYYKFLKKNSDFTQCDELNEGQSIDWVLNEAKNLGASLSRQDAGYLVNRIGLNQQLLKGELSKLISYDENITRKNIDELTSEKPQSSVFNLLDAAFAGNSRSALKIYDEQKAQGSQPQSIFGMLVWQANIIATVAAGANMSAGELSAATGIKPFSISKANGVYKKIGRQGVSDLLNRLVDADRQIKTKSVDPDEVLKNLLLTIS
jgi:DNA polymerase III subunit delta